VLVDARQMSESEAVAAVVGFVEKNGTETLNVAGPRASGWKRDMLSRQRWSAEYFRNLVDRQCA